MKRRIARPSSRIPRSEFRMGLALGLVAWCLAHAVAAKETLVHDVAEFNAAVNGAEPGDQIVLADGEWRDADLIFRATGKESLGGQIMLRAEHPGKVVLTGKSRLRLGGEFLWVSGLCFRDVTTDDCVIDFRVDSKTLASLCTLDQCAILGDAPGAERKWVSLYGSTNYVGNCRFERKQSGGTLLVVWLGEGRAYHRIEKNLFGPRPRLGKNGGEIIRLGDSKTSLQESETRVRGNYFYHCDGEAEIISNKSCGNAYLSNLFIGCRGALTLRHGNDCFVTNNVFYADGRSEVGGVRVIGENHVVKENSFLELTGDDGRAALSLMNGIPDSPANGYFQVRSGIATENFFFHCKQNIVVGLADKDQKRQTLPPTEVYFHRNTVISSGPPVFDVRTPPTLLRHEHNEFFGGEVGLDAAAGWTRLAEDRVRGRQADQAHDLVVEHLRTKLSRGEFGPYWMPLDDASLPEIIRKQND